jgi:hypothetical protein
MQKVKCDWVAYALHDAPRSDSPALRIIDADEPGAVLMRRIGRSSCHAFARHEDDRSTSQVARRHDGLLFRCRPQALNVANRRAVVVDARSPLRERVGDHHGCAWRLAFEHRRGLCNAVGVPGGVSNDVDSLANVVEEASDVLSAYRPSNHRPVCVGINFHGCFRVKVSVNLVGTFSAAPSSYPPWC